MFSTYMSKALDEVQNQGHEEGPVRAGDVPDWMRSGPAREESARSESSDTRASEAGSEKEQTSETPEEGRDSEVSEEEQTSETSHETFTSIREEDLPEEARGVFRQMQADYQARVQGIQASQEQLQRAQEYSAFLDRLSTDEGLRRHVLGYFQQQDPSVAKDGASAESSSVLDRKDFSEYSDDEYKEAEILADRVLKAVENRYGATLKEHQQTVTRVNELMEQLEAQQEMQELHALHPGWNQNVDPRDLASAKERSPGISVLNLYRMLDYDKAQARVKRGVFNNGKKQKLQTSVLERGRAEEEDKTKGIKSFSDALQLAIEDFGYR